MQSSDHGVDIIILCSADIVQDFKPSYLTGASSTAVWIKQPVRLSAHLYLTAQANFQCVKTQHSNACLLHIRRPTGNLHNNSLCVGQFMVDVLLVRVCCNHVV